MSEFQAFSEGWEAEGYKKLGAHLQDGGGVAFRVWAPNAERVTVIGDFNGWEHERDRLAPVGYGVWAGFVPSAKRGDRYKYRITAKDGRTHEKADPYGVLHEVPPATASVVWSLEYAWGDDAWMKDRGARQRLESPISVYEVHLGSWARVPEDGNRSLTYREIAPKLARHVQKLGFTHVELLPVMEHPFFGSWGYGTTGYFAPSSRFGTPQDLMFLIDYLHQQGIGVFLDWVPAHFPTDAHALGYFDGTHLYEHADPRQGFHPDWNTLIFNYGRHEVRSFLLSSADMWISVYHADGLRVDGVASMLYLDYSRKQGEWIANEEGGRENLAAIRFLTHMNSVLYGRHPGIQISAEESTAFPRVTKPLYLGGLGFGLKWDMGWMHDSLRYFAEDPVYRRWHQNELTFRSMYAYSENFVLPLSHDEVVHGKGSLYGKMPGDAWQKIANLRALYSWMYAQPGKKLLFMGAELASPTEWNHDASLDWHLEEDPARQGLEKLIQRLNELYRERLALHARDAEFGGFEWIDGSNAAESVLVFLRRGETARDVVLCVFNLTPTPRPNYRVGVPCEGQWREIFNSDAKEYGGSGHGNLGGVESVPLPWNGRKQSLVITLPPLAAVFFEPVPDDPGAAADPGPQATTAAPAVKTTGTEPPSTR